jgi:capsular exopolysaccharide synthesis family protein
MIPAETLEATFPAAKPESRLVAIAAPQSSAAEQYRILLRRLDALAQRRPMRVVAVTSGSRGEGRTTTAANLALTAAREGRPTLLVDGDLRRPSLADLFDLVPRAGLAEAVAGTAELSEAVVRAGPLAVLCAGEVRDPLATLRDARLATVVESLRATYALVVIDAPPALSFLDGDRLAAATDGALLVVRAQSTPRAVVKLAADALGELAAGIVLNAVDAAATVHGRWLFADADARAG